MKSIAITAAAPVRPLDTPRWRPGQLYAAPHRLAFAAGTVLLMAVSAWWAFTLLGRARGWALPQALPATTLHQLLMGFGFMPLFFTGFLFTAGPRWLGLAPVPARSLRAGVQAQVAGWLVLLLAGFAADPLLARLLGGLGVAAAAAGWGRLVLRFGRMVALSPAADKQHASVVLVASALGAALMALAAGALAAGRLDWVRETVLVGLWAFAGVVYAAVAHRMIPFFTGAVLPFVQAWRPGWLLGVFTGVLAFEGFTVWAPVPAPLQAAVEAAAALLWLGLALRWGLVKSLQFRLLAMLHLGFGWLGVAMALQAADHILALAGGPSLGLAPLHAYTMGFLGSTLVAMATRVSAGHSGRALAVDTPVWLLFWLLQAAVLGRIMADLAGLPVWLPALAWAAALLPWGWRHLGWYGRPRLDGQPG